MYQAIYKSNVDGSSVPLDYNDETKRYISMRYALVTNNWDLSNSTTGNYGITYKYYDAIRCSKYHFMDNSTDEIAFKGLGNTYTNEFFEGWENYNIMCLNMDHKNL